MKGKMLSLFVVSSLILTGCSVEDAINGTNIDLNFDSLKNVGNSESKESVDTSGNYKEVSVDACDLSGDRKSNVMVDVGMDTNYATRDYYAYTNEYGQLVKVEADDIIIQNDKKESNDEKGDGRYCSDEAKVKGVEASDLDEGHAIADSLGGVSNAYNITPQDSTLNRSGAQYDMEEDIRSAEATGKDVTDFVYNIEYDNTKTMTPSNYYGSYNVNGKTINFSFENN